MSFKCGITNKVVFNERCHKVVIERREKIYRDEEGNEIGKGYEIVRELNVSEEGLAKLNTAAANMDQLSKAAE